MSLEDRYDLKDESGGQLPTACPCRQMPQFGDMMAYMNGRSYAGPLAVPVDPRLLHMFCLEPAESREKRDSFYHVGTLQKAPHSFLRMANNKNEAVNFAIAQPLFAHDLRRHRLVIHLDEKLHALADEQRIGNSLSNARASRNSATQQQFGLSNPHFVLQLVLVAALSIDRLGSTYSIEKDRAPHVNSFASSLLA
ncbi:MAG TPA: hypothetical protein VE988_02770 [Gemmataceae bacterium]|nr:hypothetical protein [Gemmataceae bacterium]